MADLAFLWHMHQPDYRHPETGDFVLPWVLLHAIKDYTDMACHLERHPGVRCTVNFVPVLLDQIEDYCDQLGGGQWRDPLLRIVAHPDPDLLTAAEKDWLLDMAFRCHAPTMLEPFAPYRRLRDLLAFVRSQDANAMRYLSGSFYADLATWFLLAWTGESLRRDRHAGAATDGQGRCIRPRRTAAPAGRNRRRAAPADPALPRAGRARPDRTFLHPGQPPAGAAAARLQGAREAWPESPLPSSPEYPGGRSRVAAHLDSAGTSHAARFGTPPAGMWPAEGALSAAFLNQIGNAGFAWTASSHGVLRHSAGNAASTSVAWQAPAGTPGDITLFFRNEHLSDLIGFEYANWHGRDAAQHFMGELQAVHAGGRQQPDHCLPRRRERLGVLPVQRLVLLFRPLRRAREEPGDPHRDAAPRQPREHHGRRQRLPRLTAGSWVYGTLSTWLGHTDKNRAWDLLCEVKQSVDRALESGRLTPAERAAVLHRLAVCESSDWFWWLGDYNSPQSVASFDSLFRDNLRSLYRLLQLPAPASLDHPISHGAGSPESGGTMRRAT